ncbi:hypothetical protein BB561_001945 [Smittium simulii]|uniref:CCHC-type domain-containing protein n=1 Tax=Smittium simulii TaxID=133385 RepID=A0A2T9YSJ3_9FUNG|nr:hypothetical protein BB561_001945 [Smittium simulii]
MHCLSQSAAVDVPYHSVKCTRLEYSIVAKTVLIDHVPKNDYHFNFPAKNSQKNEKITKNQKKIGKFENFQQNNKNNLKKIINPALNPREFTEVSIMHLLDNSIPKALKKACYDGSNTKVGSIDYVALKIDDEYVSYQHYSRAKATFFMFYNEGAVELYQTVKLEEGTQIITIPSTNSTNIRMVVGAVNNNFTKNRIIYDFSAYKNKTLTYRGCKPVCSFCKQQRHWKSDCPELEKFKQNKLKNTKKIAKSVKILIDNFFLKSSKKNEQKIILGEVHNEIALQVKAIKDNTKSIKLQSLELKTKTWNRFTEFNSIKQLEEMDLELLDQKFMLTAAAWHKSNENYTGNNVSVAVIDMDLVNELADNNGFNDAEMQRAVIDIKQISPNCAMSSRNTSVGKIIFFKAKGYTCVESKKYITKIGSVMLIAVKNKSEWPVSELRGEYTWISYRAKIQINSDKIINNNYYSVLYSSIKNNAEELGTNECIEKLLGASASILNDLEVLNAPAMPKARNQHFEKFKKLKINTLKLLKSLRKKNTTKKSTETTTAIIDEKCQLIIGEKECLAIWTNNFAKLAQKTTNGDNNFSLFSLNKIDVLSECDIAPTWSDITTALKTTPSNKAADIDTIPSELWKLVQNEIQPTSYLAKIINKTINKAWDNCNLIGTTNTSVVVPIFKSGNCQVPNNYR